jgi:predicted TPR repeat methyltransferase
VNRTERRLQRKQAKKARGKSGAATPKDGSSIHLTKANVQALELAIKFHTAGQFAEAERLYQQTLQADPHHSDALNLLGVLNSQIGNQELAMELIGRALANRPDFAEAHNNLGNVQLNLGRSDEAERSYQKALEINPQYAQAHYNLGKQRQDRNDLKSAIESYQKSLAISPEFIDAHYNLGIGHKDSGSQDAAIASFQKVISLDPNHHRANHLLNSLLGRTTETAPREYVEDVFDSYAVKFDKHLQDDLSYNAPRLLKNSLTDSNLIVGKFERTVDLGCGTGLAGIEFRDLTEELIGIDVSKNMISEAHKKGVYDTLHIDDIVNALNASEVKYDLFISTDVFIYVGALLPVFRCVKAHAAENAIFAFSTERIEGDGFTLGESGRYSHAKEYVFSVAAECGFQVESYTQFDLRRHGSGWIEGDIFILSC